MSTPEFPVNAQVQNEENISLRSKIIFSLQHVLVMAAAPITAVFLIAKALHFTDAVTASVLSATFMFCGIGTLLQSLGVGGFGARLPFVMVPGGAPVAIFVTIALQSDIQTAVGSVLITSVAYFIVLPLFRRLLAYFPPFVVGIMLLLVSINLVKLYGSVVVGSPGSPGYAASSDIMLMLATIFITLIFVLAFKGVLRRLAVMLGLLAGTLLAVYLGKAHFTGLFQGGLLTVPKLFPFGLPKFDLVATLPLLIYSVISMFEATGQTIATASVVNSSRNVYKLVPRTIRGDAVISLLGGLFGTSLIITSGENIGVVRTTNVKSRHVTALAGVFLILASLFSPLVQFMSVLPAAVVCGTAVMVFSIIGVIGMEMIAKEKFHDQRVTYTLALALAMGLLPILIPGFYSQFPKLVQMTLGNGMAAGTLTAILVNSLFLWRETRGAGREKISR